MTPRGPGLICSGVIIPLVEEYGSEDSNGTGVSWQYSTCLKWGYADSIKLLDMPAGQFDIPGINPSRSLVRHPPLNIP
jgi:hypothetical protein